MRDPKGDIDDKARLDKWLWQARFFKSRRLASDAVKKGIRVNAVLTTKPSMAIKAGDVLTFTKEDHVKVIEILSLTTRRGPAKEAQTLYLDQSDARADQKESNSKRIGRPNKKERRDIRNFLQSHLE